MKVLYLSNSVMSPQHSPIFDLITTQIESLSHEGRGISHIDGKTVFISGGLPTETVKFRYLTRQKRFDEGCVVEVLSPAKDRLTPRCPHFGLCGGCCLQHLSQEAQLQLKQNYLLEHFSHIGQVQPETLVSPLTGPEWGYRRKARLGVKYVAKKHSVLVGFREQRRGFLAELTRCEILHPSVGERILSLRELVGQLEAKEAIAQIEMAVDDMQSALVFRNLVPLTESDQNVLRTYAQTHDLYIYLQPQGPEDLISLWPTEIPVPGLEYTLPSEQVSIRFAPSDFVQINTEVNQQMVPQALRWLELQATDRVLDLFCGLGNFTLPLAKRAAHVTGIEGEAKLLKRAHGNAQRQGIENIDYHVANLADKHLDAPWMHQAYDKVLFDPPRSGAIEIIQALALTQVERIVYVSCNPSTLARDAGELVHKKGFKLKQVGVMDMFPHTAHVEVMALFERA